jgi:DnaD/phage-associated family protein
MARPKKQTIEYFPHYVNSGKTMFILESNFGNDGYAFWFKLLELLGSTNGMYYDYNNLTNREFLLAKTRLNEVTVNRILDTLANLDAIDKELWYQEKMIWSQNLVNNVRDAFKRRIDDMPQKPLLYTETPPQESLCIQKPSESDVSADKNGESKVKESKVNQSKENNNNNVVVPVEDKNIYQVYENCGYGTISSFIKDSLDGMVNGFTFEWAKEALEIGATNGSRNLKYVQAILNNWKNKGKDSKPYKENKKTPSYQDYKQKEYDIPDLEKKLLGWDKEE